MYVSRYSSKDLTICIETLQNINAAKTFILAIDIPKYKWYNLDIGDDYMNKVIKGYGMGCAIIKDQWGIGLTFRPEGKGVRALNKGDKYNSVTSYEILNTEESISTSSAIKRGIVGSLIGSTVGGVIGASTAKQNKAYTILVHWKDSKDSLIEIDEEYYKVFIKNMI